MIRISALYYFICMDPFFVFFNINQENRFSCEQGIIELKKIILIDAQYIYQNKINFVILLINNIHILNQWIKSTSQPSVAVNNCYA